MLLHDLYNIAGCSTAMAPHITHNADVVSCPDAPPTHVWVECLTGKARLGHGAPGARLDCHVTVSHGASDCELVQVAAVYSMQVLSQ